MHLLVVEDDDAIADPLVDGLRREGFEVDRVATGQAALDHPLPDAFLLDLGLPDIDGNEVCRRLRAASEVPIIVITARSDEVDRVIGLELGADDYVVKPFGFRELVARIRAVTRRAQRPSGGAEPEAKSPVTVLSGGRVVVDTRTRRVTVDGADMPLTRKEFDVVALLLTDPGATLTRDEILRTVWDEHWYGPSKTLDVHVASIRKKLGDPGLIETVRGVGFRLRVDG